MSPETERLNIKLLFLKTKGAVLQPSVIIVFVLVALWNISVSSDWLGPRLPNEGIFKETCRGLRDVNLRVQMRFYQSLTGNLPIPFQTTHVTLAYIDNQAFWDFYHGQEPINRSFLAALLHNLAVAQTKPQAIGLDVSLFAPRNIPALGSNSIRDYDTNFELDAHLLSAIQEATRAGIPVVLASADYPDQEDRNQFTEIPNIFPRELLSPKSGCGNTRCPTFGFTELPDDERKIPLTHNLHLDSSREVSVGPSFALAVAEAANDPTNSGQASILSQISKPDDTFGTFAPEINFTKRGVSALAIASGNARAINSCGGKIVLVGGHWQSLQGFGRLVDQHPTPVGTMSGLALNANYIESLKQEYWTSATPDPFGIGIDFFVGLLIFGGFEMARGLLRKSMVLFIAFLVPILCAYLAITTAHRYLDFLLPLELYFLHILYEVAVLLMFHRGHSDRVGTS